jgi:hypothetical protein
MHFGEDVSQTLCFDPRGVVPRETFYDVGQIEPDSVMRYTPDEALELADRTGHSGPWNGELITFTPDGEVVVEMLSNE